MSNQAKFYNLPTEAPPLNRRIYDAAKLPFSYLFVMFFYIARPWVFAFPVAMCAAGLISYLVNQKAIEANGLWSVAEQTFSVGLVWTAYLGAAFLAVKLLRAIFE